MRSASPAWRCHRAGTRAAAPVIRGLGAGGLVCVFVRVPVAYPRARWCGYPGCADAHLMCARRAGWLMSDAARQEQATRICGRHPPSNGDAWRTESRRRGRRRRRGRERGDLIHGGRGGRGGRGASRRRAPPRATRWSCSNARVSAWRSFGCCASVLRRRNRSVARRNCRRSCECRWRVGRRRRRGHSEEPAAVARQETGVFHRGHGRGGKRDVASGVRVRARVT